MSVIQNIIESNAVAILLVIFVLLLLSLIWNIILSIKVSSLNSKYKRFMRGASGKNFESLLMDHASNVESAIERVNILNDDLIDMRKQIDRCIQKCNIIRYNAFSNTGSDLSFSIAMLDNFNDGFIITGIYGRNETVTYAKPITKGISKYPLSVEEELVLNRSLKGNESKRT